MLYPGGDFLHHFSIRITLAGAAAGIINGLFGAGGGMILVPMFSATPDLNEQDLFPSSISIMLPICVVSLLFSGGETATVCHDALGYLLGSGIGGILAGLFGKRISTLWLHRFLGILILWGGFRYLWQ